jgi:integrase
MLANVLEELRPITETSGFVLPFFHLDCYHDEFKRSAHAAGVKEIRFHDLRHTFASHFLMGGGNIYDLQRILGHSSVQVTERYTHLMPEHLRGKTEVLGF